MAKYQTSSNWLVTITQVALTMGKPNRVQDDLMMTIASDDELSEVEASSDEENEEETVLKDAIISKVSCRIS